VGDSFPTLNLRQVGGEPVAGGDLALTETTLIGRSSQSDLHLDDPGVSRRHAELRPGERGWILVDLSTHGTFVNGVQVDQGLAYPLAAGDQIRIGAWVFEVGGEGHSGARTLVAESDVGTQTRRVSVFDRSRLRVLGELSELLTGAADEAAVAEAMVHAALAGSPFEWGAVVRAGRGEPELVAGVNVPVDASVSRTLLAQASEGLAILEPGFSATPASLIGTSTRSAIAAPVGGWSLYVAGSKGAPIDDAYTAYVEVVTRMGALALSDRRRRDLERRQAQYVEELAAARRVQERFLPGVGGGAEGGWLIDPASAPGTGMAGDILGAVSATDGALTVFIGDVVGKGSAASIVMTAAQSYLEARLRSGEPLSDVVSALNRFVAGRTLGAEFLTLWIGRLDGRGGLEYVDAGHGYAFRSGAGGVKRLKGAGGIPVGIDPESSYGSATEAFDRAHVLLLCSDGVVEQRDPTGEEFSLSRLESLLRDSGGALTADSLLSGVREFARRDGLDDDFTACVVKHADQET